MAISVSAAKRCALPAGCSRRTAVRVRAATAVDVEAQRRAAPNTGPNAGTTWPPPPPPPPPPKPPKRLDMQQPPSRREALFGFLGAGVGVAATAGFYNTTYDLSADSYEKALDSLLDNEQFLDSLSDEVLYRQYDKELDQFGNRIDAMVDLDQELQKLRDDLEKIDAEEARK